MSHVFLLGIDFEDVSLELTEDGAYTQRIPSMTERLLSFLAKHQVNATFFSTGDIARKFPSLIAQIQSEGHEIACHSNNHHALTTLSEAEFEEDLKANIDALVTAGASQIKGFRAPFYSLTKECDWAYKVLKKMGFTYSSSVLPAASPLFGWKEFGEEPKEHSGLLELPVSVLPWSHFKIPFAGGVYFKVFPPWFLGRILDKHSHTQNPLVGYLHPQDIDNEFGSLEYKGYGRFYNTLLNFNKGSVLKKMGYIVKKGYKVQTYLSYTQSKSADYRQ